MSAIERCAAPVCVGIDPVVEKLPEPLARVARDAPARAIGEFGLGVIDAVAGTVPCVKVQAACFERFGVAGVAALHELVAAARERGLLVILDAKRGDIGASAEHYAAAAFGPDGPGADWITVSAYFGEDGIEPFLRPGRGAFALVRTSNPGGDAVQALALADGRTVADAVAELVATIGRRSAGSSGYSSLGAVVGATRPQAAARLRAAMPQQIFLVPGYGAQGAGAEDVRPCFDRRGRGAIVTASRSIIYPDAAGRPWPQAVRDAARALADEVGRVAGLR